MKKTILIAILSAVLAGCSDHSHKADSYPETPITKPMVMSDTDLLICLQTNRYTVNNCSIVSNGKMWIPTEAWFENELPGIISRFQALNGQGPFEDEANDCDSFSKAAVVAARFGHKNSNKVPGTSIAVGEYYYVKWSTGEKHAIICGLVRTDVGKYKLMFLEPQTSKVIKLSAEEMATCSNYIF